jgi:hypothetical protein
MLVTCVAYYVVVLGYMEDLWRMLRWWRQSGDKYNLGAQFINNYR